MDLYQTRICRRKFIQFCCNTFEVYCRDREKTKAVQYNSSLILDKEEREREREEGISCAIVQWMVSLQCTCLFGSRAKMSLESSFFTGFCPSTICWERIDCAAVVKLNKLRLYHEGRARLRLSIRKMTVPYMCANRDDESKILMALINS